MHWLEARFRRKFEPQGEGYLYRREDRAVLFDADDVEALVIDWRRYWLNPWLWGILLVFGVMAPVAGILWGNQTAQLYLVLLVPFVWLSCLVCLGVSQGGPDTAASKLEPVGPGRGPAYWNNIFLIVIGLLNLATFTSGGALGNWNYLIWPIPVLLGVAGVVRAYRWRRAARIAEA